MNDGNSRFSSYSYERLEETSSDDQESKVSRRFKVIIYEKQRRMIDKWVLKYKNIETGGDLFGLWIDSHTAIVQFVLGPGENCRRTPTSFHQDLQYLDKAGRHLTQRHGLCNIGQWHSHHQLNLPKPSGGDETTVWENMPNLGLTRYIVCIATISRQSQVYNTNLNCFLFELKEGRKQPILRGKFQRLKGNSPFAQNSQIVEYMKEGAEKASLQSNEDNDRNFSPSESERLSLREKRKIVRTVMAFLLGSIFLAGVIVIVIKLIEGKL